jgi:hypothetical protein
MAEQAGFANSCTADVGLRAHWLHNPRLRAAEILTSPTTAAILATRRV